MPQLRQNIITGDWVVIAPERSKRPSDFISAESLKVQSKDGCPFCPTGSSYKKERLKDFENEHVYVFPNKYPAFVEDPTNCSARAYRLEDQFYNARPSTGGHDVIAVKNHDHQLYDFSLSTWTDLLSMAKSRYKYWRQDCNTEYSMLIYNQGVWAGASIQHPHAQIFASNIVPNHISKEILGSLRYFETNGACVFCDLIHHEKTHRVRIIEENDQFVAFAFYAARFPFEVWVLPKDHSAHYEDEKESVIRSLGEIMKSIIGMLGKTLSKPALNFFVHDAPTNENLPESFHWHIEIAPRVSSYGGFELGSGTIIGVIAPEDAAKYLRKFRTKN